MISSHGDLYRFVTRLGAEQKDPELRPFAVAGTLHQSFYENWLHEEVVREYAEDINKLLNCQTNVLEINNFSLLPFRDENDLNTVINE